MANSTDEVPANKELDSNDFGCFYLFSIYPKSYFPRIKLCAVEKEGLVGVRKEGPF